MRIEQKRIKGISVLKLSGPFSWGRMSELYPVLDGLCDCGDRRFVLSLGALDPDNLLSRSFLSRTSEDLRRIGRLLQREQARLVIADPYRSLKRLSPQLMVNFGTYIFRTEKHAIRHLRNDDDGLGCPARLLPDLPLDSSRARPEERAD